MANEYNIVVEPEGENDDSKNAVGFVLYLDGFGSYRKEVSRVAFVRRNSKNPNTSFEDQLAHEVDKARAAVKVLNEQLTGAGELQ